MSESWDKRCLIDAEAGKAKAEAELQSAKNEAMRIESGHADPGLVAERDHELARMQLEASNAKWSGGAVVIGRAVAVHAIWAATAIALAYIIGVMVVRAVMLGEG